MIQSIRMTASFSSTSTFSSSTIRCRQCGHQIKFDDKRTSQRTGKKIPLDVNTNEPHNCPVSVWKDTQPNTNTNTNTKERRYVQCNKGCGGEVYFDVNTKTSTGRWIPISKATGLPHQCQ
jgi:DNA-directed RNA polymerase subunit RPC12/RpoP